MQLLFDTNILIGLRDGDAATIARFSTVKVRPSMSIVSQIELENGCVREPFDAAARLLALDKLLQEFVVVPFAAEDAARYRSIVGRVGYSRARVLDRMIAATALRLSATVVTANARDFRDVPGLTIEDWSN